MRPRHSSRSVESSSSPDNSPIARVQRGISLWNKGDWEAALEDLDPEVEWWTSGAVPGLEELYRGHDGVRRFWTSWTETWESIRIDTEQVVERGDDVFVYARFKARGRDGMEVDQPVAFQFTSGDSDLLVRFKSYWNRDDVPLDVRTSETAP
jgi:ketosteroid isomerase-like protein